MARLSGSIAPLELSASGPIATRMLRLSEPRVSFSEHHPMMPIFYSRLPITSQRGFLLRDVIPMSIVMLYPALQSLDTFEDLLCKFMSITHPAPTHRMYSRFLLPTGDMTSN